VVCDDFVAIVINDSLSLDYRLSVLEQNHASLVADALAADAAIYRDALQALCAPQVARIRDVDQQRRVAYFCLAYVSRHPHNGVVYVSMYLLASTALTHALSWSASVQNARRTRNMHWQAIWRPRQPRKERARWV